MSSFEIRNLLGLRDGKRIYVIDSNHVSQEEYEYCQVLTEVLWGEKGLVNTLGPTWNMILDPRFEKIENQFVVERTPVFGGDARLGKQYVDGNSIMSHSMAELETYAEILGEGRFFLEVVRKDGIDPNNFCALETEILWKYIRRECPNYFDNVDQLPNSRAQRLFHLFRSDLVGLVADYADTALLDEWIKLESGETATQADFNNSHEEPVVYAEVDVLERSLTMRSSLRVTAVKILEKTGLLALIEKQNFQLTDFEIDHILKMVYSLPYEKLHLAAANVLTYVTSVVSTPYTQRLATERTTFMAASLDTISKLKSGEIKSLTVNDQEEIGRELTLEEKQIVALRKDPNRLELFLMLVEAEKENDTATINLIMPILENTDEEIPESVVASVKEKSRVDRTASAARNVIGLK